MNIKNILVTLAVAALLVGTSIVWACGEIIPPEPIAKLALESAYKDFPRMADILAVMRIESSFEVDAISNNLADSGTSNGVMQVNGGPFELTENVKEGVGRLREYYLLILSRLRKDTSLTNFQRFELAKQGAVKAYNIGIGTYLAGRGKISSADYYSKFYIQRAIYEKYPKEVRYLGEYLGCSSHDPRYGKVISRPAGSNLLVPYREPSRGANRNRKLSSNKG